MAREATVIPVVQALSSSQSTCRSSPAPTSRATCGSSAWAGVPVWSARAWRGVGDARAPTARSRSPPRPTGPMTPSAAGSAGSGRPRPVSARRGRTGLRRGPGRAEVDPAAAGAERGGEDPQALQDPGPLRGQRPGCCDARWWRGQPRRGCRDRPLRTGQSQPALGLRRSRMELINPFEETVVFGKAYRTPADATSSARRARAAPDRTPPRPRAGPEARHQLRWRRWSGHAPRALQGQGEGAASGPFRQGR